MVNTTEALKTAADGWVIEVMPNRGRPVTNWMVVGPYYDSGSVTDGQGVAEWMFDDEVEALAYASEAAEDWPYHVSVIVYPADPIA